MILEICVESLTGAKAAQLGGADRIEVCDCLALGGLTPNLDLVEQCMMLWKPNVMMMIRPHARDFIYDQDELSVMRNSICDAKRLGVQGVVFGALDQGGRLDKEACRRLIDAARPLEITFHRAFDECREPMQTLEDLIELGFDRVLTSGQAETATGGVAMLRQLVQSAEGRVSIIVAGNVRAENIHRLKVTGAREFHSSAKVRAATMTVEQSGPTSDPFEVCESEVRRLSIALHSVEL